MSKKNEFRIRDSSIGPIFLTGDGCKAPFIDRISTGNIVCLDHKNDDNNDIDFRVYVRITMTPSDGHLQGEYRGIIEKLSSQCLTLGSLAEGQEIEFDFNNIMSVYRDQQPYIFS